MSYVIVTKAIQITYILLQKYCKMDSTVGRLIHLCYEKFHLLFKEIVHFFSHPRGLLFQKVNEVGSNFVI